MNNLHRELAPISAAAWAQMEEEASRTIKRHLAARRVVDVEGPKGFDFPAVGTGHRRQIQTPGDGIEAAQRETRPLVELRVPFELSREAIDDVERGSNDSDWSPLKDAARKIASLLRLAGVNGPYALLLGAEPYAAIGGATDHGYPILQHIQHLVDGKIVWTPAIEGGVVLTTRGGDFELTIGQDISIGYLSHSETAVQLYLQETITFLLLTTEAAVSLAPQT